MAEPITGAVIASGIGSAVSSLFGGSSAKKAAREQARAIREQTAFMRETWETSLRNLAPFIEPGEAAQDALMERMGFQSVETPGQTSDFFDRISGMVEETPLPKFAVAGRYGPAGQRDTRRTAEFRLSEEEFHALAAVDPKAAGHFTKSGGSYVSSTTDPGKIDQILAAAKTAQEGMEQTPGRKWEYGGSPFPEWQAPGYDPETGEVDWSVVENDPRFQFMEQQGVKTIERSAASRGRLASGATLRSLQDFGGNLAAQHYSQMSGESLQQWSSNYGQYLTELSNLGSILSGARAAAAGSAQVANQGAANIAVGNIHAAQAQAAGTRAGGQMWGNIFQTGANTYGLANMFSQQPPASPAVVHSGVPMANASPWNQGTSFTDDLLRNLR